MTDTRMINAAKMLRQLRDVPGLEDAVICGGFLRDLITGVQPKDIDIFCFVPEASRLGGPRGEGWMNPSRHLERVLSGLDAYGFAPKEFNPDLMYPMEEGSTEVVGVIELEKTLDGLPVQIIMVDRFGPENVMERFDYGICRVMHDGTRWLVHPHFVEDLQDKVFRLRRERIHMTLMSSVERYARMKPRYPDWRFAAFDDNYDDWEKWGEQVPYRQFVTLSADNEYTMRPAPLKVFAECPTAEQLVFNYRRPLDWTASITGFPF